VTGVAALRECFAVRIAVAGGAAIELDTRVADCPVCAGDMAVLTAHLKVCAGKWITGLRVIELRFPRDGGVTLQAVRAQRPLVLVLVTGGAGTREPEKTSVEVLDTGAFNDEPGRVTAITSDLGVLSLEGEPDAGVLKLARLPVQQRKILAVMLGMTVDASVAAPTGTRVCGVQSALPLEPRGDLAMAV